MVTEFRRFGSIFGGHVELGVPGVEWNTGNLGQGLSAGCAAALAAKVGGGSWRSLVFMGDVGALPLGGALGAVAVFSKHELLSVVIHGIFVVEFSSVIIQRYFFKMTGRRVFAMAPIHHHYEKQGWPESRVTVRFWIISIMLALVAIASIKVR